MQRYRFKVDKLVRDRTKERLNARGVTCCERIMEIPEYTQRLKNKIIEEAQEVINATTLDEILTEFADLLEVIDALAHTLNISAEQIAQKRADINAVRGTFERRAYHAYVEMDADNSNVTYLRSQPDKYPEITE